MVSEEELRMNKSPKLNALWMIILPAVLGFSSGSLADAGLSYLFEYLSGSVGQSNSAVTAPRQADRTAPEARSLEKFLSSNPFKISPQKTDTPAPPAPDTPPADPAPAEETDTKLAGLILRGTLPGIGAWCELNGSLKLILIGRQTEGYKLAAVSYTDATFRRGDEPPVKKYIIYGPIADAGQPKVTAPKQPTPFRKPEEPKQTGNIVAAAPDQEGQIPGEMVSNLVQNPFDELKRIRMRPNEKAGGLEVQWIQNDSLLKRLGVQRGDIIRSVNGIPFTNMGDIANSINSLMSSERFDVEVTRGGKNTALRYVVK